MAIIQKVVQIITLSKSDITKIKTVKRALLKHGMDLENVYAAKSLYKSLVSAKNRTKRNKSYVKKGIQFNFEHLAPRKTLVEVIQNEPVFWIEWIEQEEIFKASGYNKDYRPSLHRIDSNGNYEAGNLATVPYRIHQKENSISTNLIFADAIGKLNIGLYESVVEAQQELNVTRNTINKLQKGSYDLVGTGLTSIPMAKGDTDTFEAKRMIAQFKLHDEYEKQDNPNWQQFFEEVNAL